MGCPRCGYTGGPGRAVYDATFPCPACRRGGVVVTSNPRRNAASRLKPLCGACAQTWRWSKTNKTGYYTPCRKHEQELDEAARKRAAAKGAALARREAQRKARQAAADLRRAALERGIDDVDDVPEEARWNTRRASRPRPPRRFTHAELMAMPTLATGQIDDLKYDDGNFRVWISRASAADDESLEDLVTVERLEDGRWVEHETYYAYADGGETLMLNPPPCGQAQLAALGWDELEGAHHFLDEENAVLRGRTSRPVDLFSDLKGAAGQGDLATFKRIFDGEYDLEGVIDFYVEFQPDDILGTFVRVWARFDHPVDPTP